ncbi:uncharacterized protein LOC128242463 [Mya arenaria]|uniref:uncharacterized protein LOC128242463 n=1 Tax=Mya arenaria TaxID=6604 RepID=UPI0022E4A73D|nr:uncharacterized protein LOC128242463 [Mya arenaria]
MEKFEIQTTTFLRYMYVTEFIAEQDKKCNYFLKKFHPKSEQSQLRAHPSIQLIFQGKEVLPRNILDGFDVKHAEGDIPTSDLENLKTEEASKPLIIVKQMRNNRQNISIEIDQTKVISGWTSQDTELISKVDLLLEKIVLNQFKTKIDQLCRIKDEIANNDVPGGQKTKKRKLSIDQTTLRSGKGFHPLTKSAFNGETIELDEMEQEVLADTIRSGQAFFRRRGYTAEAQEKYQVLTDEVSDGIFSIDQRIRGCGYRNRILNIYVDEQDFQEQSQISKSIDTTLQVYHILDFKVIFGLYQVQLLSGCVAGGEVVNEFGLSGTLGGYTRSNAHEYGLLARHFAEPDMDTSLEEHASVYCKGGNNSKTKIGEVVKCREKGEYDISAAKMILGPSETRLRNAKGKHVPSSLFLFNEGNQEERPVYIWAKGETMPRKGIIAIPYYKRRTLQGHYVLIEDTSELDSETNTFRWKRLCERGQSGAIFCSDEPDGTCAHAISMLEGMQNYKEVDADPNKKGLYLSFGLYKGLEQLKTEIGEQLELC